MNTGEIYSMLNYINKGVKQRHFIDVCPADMLPKRFRKPAAIVVNTDASNLPGSHWVAIYASNDRKSIEYFDSYALPPMITHHLTFLDRKSVKVKCKRLQSDTSQVCGHYCLAFLHARMNGKSFKKFLSQYSTNTAKNDRIVKKTVENMFGHVKVCKYGQGCLSRH